VGGAGPPAPLPPSLSTPVASGSVPFLQCQVKRLVGKNVSEMTHFVSSGMQNLITQSVDADFVVTVCATFNIVACVSVQTGQMELCTLSPLTKALTQGRIDHFAQRATQTIRRFTQIV